ncbi:MAG: GDP-mannose 4,6-dehydratase [Bacteroidota bacterium]
MQNVLLTGCAGFIGSHTAEMLLKSGNKVFGLDNFDNFYSRDLKERNISNFKNNPDFYLFEADITDRNTFALLPENIDFVIHFAAKAGVRPSIENPKSYINTNIIGTQNILSWMTDKNIKKMLFASSSSVYGNNKKVPFSENDNTDFPISPYAFTKKSCEQLNYMWHELYNIDIVNLRFFTVYGPRQRPDLAIRKFAGLISDNKPITMFGDGNSGRDYTYIYDILSGIEKSIRFLNNNNNVYEIINLGNSNPVKLTELTDLLYSILGKEKNIIYKPKQSGDVNFTYADISKAEKLLDFKPQTSLKDGLNKFIKWLKDNR